MPPERVFGTHGSGHHGSSYAGGQVRRPMNTRLPDRRLIALTCLPAAIGLLLAATPLLAQTTETEERAKPGLRASVRFISPSPSDVAYGQTLIHVSVSPPSGTVVRRVAFFADGLKLSSDRLPPYQALWDAGERMGSHTLRAVAVFSDGTTAEDAITTRGLVFSEYELVEGKAIERAELLVSVVDRSGSAVTGLVREDFEVREAGAPVEILAFDRLSERNDLPLSIAVLVDRSGSMRFKMEEWREACVELLVALRPVDQVRVSAFADRTVVLQDFTRDAVSLADSLERIGPAEGWTRLYSAAFETIRDVRDLPGQKSIFILTDGLDTEFMRGDGLGSAKVSAILSAAERLAIRSGVSVIVILPGASSHGYLPIQKLAAQTGGWTMYSSGDLAALMRRLGEQLLGAYLMEYEVARARDPDARRNVKVRLTREHDPGWEIHARLGAYGRLEIADILKDDLKLGSPAQRARAVTEIGRLGFEESGALLLKSLKDPSPEVRKAALAMLAERRDPETLDDVFVRIHDADRGVREAAFAAAVRFGSEAVPYLLVQGSRKGRARAGALRTLGGIGDPRALPVLEKALGDDDCEVRTAAADGAGLLFEATGGGLLTGDAAEAAAAGAGVAGAAEPDEGSVALRLLEAAMEDPCPEAADAATLALGRLAHPAALQRLIAIAAGAATSTRRAESFLVLTSYLTPEGFRTLESHLVSGAPIAPHERRAAAALYAAAVRTALWLSTEEGLTRVTDLGVVEGQEVLLELRRLGEALQAMPLWRQSIEILLQGLSDQASPAEDAPDAAGLDRR